MASPGDNNEGDHHKTKGLQLGNVGIIASHSLRPVNAPVINVHTDSEALGQDVDRSQNSVDLDITVGSAENVQTGDTNVLVLTNSPQGTSEGNPDIEEDGRLPSLKCHTADKSTDTSFDEVHARGYRMGVADRLHLCYLEGPDFVQIANCCTYIEVNINNELVQNIRSQGCLKAEVANGQSLVTFKWGSLEGKREYIRCGLKTELLPKLLNNYKSLENNIIEVLLRNCDDKVKLIVELFFREYEASLLEIVEGCLVFEVLVPDVEAKDRLYSPDSLSSIAKFLEDLLVTNTIREKAGHHQLSFQVTPLSDWSQMRPYDKHMFQFNTNVTRESSLTLKEDTLRQLIQTVVSQEIQAGLSKVQVSLADTVARAVSTEMQKFKISEQELFTEKPLTGDISQVDHSQGVENPQDDVNQGLENPQDDVNQGLENPQDDHSQGLENPQDDDSHGLENSSTGSSSQGPGSSPLGSPSLLPGSLPLLDSSTLIHPPPGSGNAYPDTKPPHPGASRDCSKHTGMKPSFANILFNPQDREHVWPDPTERAAAEKILHLKGSYEPLDDDVQKAAQCVRGKVNIQRLAKLVFKHDTCTGETSELSQAPGLNTVLCLDVSDSMKNEPQKKLVQCVKKLRDEIEDNTDIALEENVGVVLFGGDVKIKLLPTNDYQRLEDAVTNLKAGGQTSPMLEALLASILLLFQTNKVQDPYFTFGEHHHYRLFPRIILMSDGLTTEGGQTEGMDHITEEVSDAVCKFLPMLLKASSNKCRINCVQFGDKSEYCSSMMENLSSETDGDAVDPTQIQWLSHYFRRQNAVGKVIDWRAQSENKEASASDIEERIQQELSDCKIEDLREQAQVREEVLNYDISESRDEDHACQSASAIESQEPDFPSARQPVLKPGDKVRKGPDWNDDQNTEDSGCELGTVINYNQKDSIVKVKWDNGMEDYYKGSNIQLQLQEGTEYQQKPSEVLNVEEGDGDLQVDCDLGSEPDDHDPSVVEEAVSLGQHNMYSLPTGVETVASGQVTDSNHKIVWQRKGKGDNWIIYSQEQIDVIEKAYTSHCKTCVITSPNKQTRYHLDFNNLQSTNLNDKSCSEIRRSEMTCREYSLQIDNL